MDVKNINFAAAALFLFSNIASTAAAAETFTYSGGCFLCTEADTEKLDGVSEVISGFTGGQLQARDMNPVNGGIIGRQRKLFTTLKLLPLKDW